MLFSDPRGLSRPIFGRIFWEGVEPFKAPENKEYLGAPSCGPQLLKLKENAWEGLKGFYPKKAPKKEGGKVASKERLLPF